MGALGEADPWANDFNGVRLGSMTSVIIQGPDSWALGNNSGLVMLLSGGIALISLLGKVHMTGCGYLGLPSALVFG